MIFLPFALSGITIDWLAAFDLFNILGTVLDSTTSLIFWLGIGFSSLLFRFRIGCSFSIL